MNIGCDLDGVIIDHSYNQALMLAERGFIVPRKDISKEKLKTLLTPAEYAVFKQELYDTRGFSAQEIDGALDALRTIASYGHIIRIISRRNKSSIQALQWIKYHGILSTIPQSHIHFVKTHEQKEKVCRMYNVTAHIDDSPEVFEALRTPPHRILFDPFSHHDYNKQVTIARSWSDVLSFITERK